MENIVEDLPVEEVTVQEENILELTDTNEYPNQIAILNEIDKLFSMLNPSNKKVVRLSIARGA